MLEWLKENYPTLIICILLAAAVAAIIARIIYNRIHHISSCSSCGSCPMAGCCGKVKKDTEKQNMSNDEKTKNLQDHVDQQNDRP